MRKIISIFLLLSVFSSASILTSAPAYAAPACSSFQSTPDYQSWNPNTNVENIEIGISGASKGTTLYAFSNRPDSPNSYVLLNLGGTKVVNNKISFNPNLGSGDRQKNTLMEGVHKVHIAASSNANASNAICELTYEIRFRFTCSIDNVDSSGQSYKLTYGPNQSVNIRGTFYGTTNDSERYANSDVDIRIFNNKGTEYKRVDAKTDGLGNFSATIGTPNPILDENVGVWYITASPDGKNLLNEQTCTRGIYISKIPGEAPPADASILLKESTNLPLYVASEKPEPSAPPAPCKDLVDGKCLKVSTAIGDIGTNPTAFIKDIFSILLGISGGLALILIMISGYRLMASQGNPEKVQEAREMMTSAVVGLLFIIFSLVILQIIGVSILQIPGFGA